jgi:L-cysteate sulfo-lyase
VVGRGATYEANGNVLLDRLFGCSLEYRPSGLDMNAEAAAVAERLREAGRRPYLIPGGGSNPTGALGYVDVAREIVEQCADQDLRFDWLVMATGSTGTHAGLLAGFHALGCDLPVMGVSVRQPRERQTAAVHALAQATVDKLDAAPIPSERTIVDDRFVGAGYGIPAASTLEAISLAARLEGLLLDPVYTGKGMAGLIGLVRERFFKASDSILFLHTGGAMALSAYEEDFSENTH